MKNTLYWAFSYQLKAKDSNSLNTLKVGNRMVGVCTLLFIFQMVDWASHVDIYIYICVCPFPDVSHLEIKQASPLTPVLSLTSLIGPPVS